MQRAPKSSENPLYHKGKLRPLSRSSQRVLTRELELSAGAFMAKDCARLDKHYDIAYSARMPYQRKTIQTYIEIERAQYNRFVALATLQGKSAAKLLGELMKKYLARKASDINDLEAEAEEKQDKED